MRGVLVGAVSVGIPLAYALHTLHRLRDQVAARDLLIECQKARRLPVPATEEGGIG